MGILTIISLLVFTSIGLFSMFKILKWVFKKKIRVIWMLLVLTSIILGITTYKLFFLKMEFIKSEVYPDLYLIKNPVKDKDYINKAIKEKVIELSVNQFKDNKVSEEILSYTLRFYEYSKGDWGENGTAYFIEHQEKSGGMFPELLEYYPKYLRAKFNVYACKEDVTNYFGRLYYYNEIGVIKIDTLLNSCKK